MAQRQKNGRFTRKQEQALTALLAHATIAEAAAAVKVDESTLRRWLRMPEFAKAWNTVRSAYLMDSVSEMQETALEAVRTLKRNLTCGEPGTEVRAADVLLSQTLRGTEILDLKRRVEAVEGLLTDGDSARAA
jgi:Helix-turn-helix of insertion element transposase